MICSHSKNFFQKNLIFFKIPVTFCLLVRISSVSATATRQNAWKQFARRHRAKPIKRKNNNQNKKESENPNMKRILALLLAALMLMTAAVACKDNTETPDGTENNDPAQSETPDTNEGSEGADDGLYRESLTMEVSV